MVAPSVRATAKERSIANPRQSVPVCSCMANVCFFAPLPEFTTIATITVWVGRSSATVCAALYQWSVVEGSAVLRLKGGAYRWCCITAVPVLPVWPVVCDLVHPAQPNSTQHPIEVQLSGVCLQSCLCALVHPTQFTYPKQNQLNSNQPNSTSRHGRPSNTRPIPSYMAGPSYMARQGLVTWQGKA